MRFEFGYPGEAWAILPNQSAPEGAEFAGITYGLRVEQGVCAVFSELTDRETVALLQIGADPLVSSLRIVV